MVSVSLLNGLIWILNNNKNNCIGKYARECVKEKFSENKVSEQYGKVYEKSFSN